MTTFVLGICCFGQHDSGACLLKDGRIAFAAEEERYTREKHDNSFPAAAIADALASEGITMQDVAHVGYYSDMSGAWVRAGLHILRYLPASLRFLKYARDYREHRSIEGELLARYGVERPVHYLKHHLCHAASTFLVSPFEEAAVLTLDGTGEWTSCTLGSGRGSHLEIHDEILFPHSLGKVYEAVTQYLGFAPCGGEGKVMGLAGFGEPRFQPLFEEIVRSRGDFGFRVDTSYFRYHLGSPTRYSRKLVAALGPPRIPESPLTQHHYDVAASLQLRLEEVALRIVRALRRSSGSANLCLAGGVALNCKMNTRILQEGGFENVFITPAASDPGTAIGAAKLVHHRVLGQTQREEVVSSRFGPAFSDEAIAIALQGRDLPVRKSDDIAGEVAGLLANGRVVGWFQGRMEFGPRALGGRSILADPRRAEMKDIVNSRVKHREGFRPFAPAVLEHRSADWFDFSHRSPFMLFAPPARPELAHEIPAVLHVDGTGRLQTVREADSELFFALITEFERLTGVPMIMNTSFNRRGEPIVCTPEDALRCFEGTEMDDLALGSYLVGKPA